MWRVPVVNMVAISIATVVSAVALAGCGGDLSRKSALTVPAEFVPACGHPGTTVEVLRVPVTVRHSDCDLTGVTLTPRGGGGGVVNPARGEGVGNSSGLAVFVHAATGDVSVMSS